MGQKVFDTNRISPGKLTDMVDRAFRKVTWKFVKVELVVGDWGECEEPLTVRALRPLKDNSQLQELT